MIGCLVDAVVGPALRRGSAMWALGIGPMHVRPRALLVRWVSQRLGTTVARGVLLYVAATFFAVIDSGLLCVSGAK